MPLVHNTVHHPIDGTPAEGATVTVSLIAALVGVGAGYQGEAGRSVQGYSKTSTNALGYWSATLVPNADLSPADTFYEVEERIPGHPPVRHDIAVPEAAATTLTGAHVLPAATITVASAAEFEAASASAPRWANVGGQLVRYTGKGATTLTGCTGGTGTIANSATVEQAYWIGDILTDPPTTLPTLHILDPTDAHDASAISFVPDAGIAATDVQAAIVELRASVANNTKGPGTLVLNALTTGTDNTVTGYAAGRNITSALQATAYGSTALDSLTTGNFNTGIGYLAGYKLETGADNTYVGGRAGEYMRSSFNTGIGSRALIGPNLDVPPPTGDNNTAVGYEALCTIGGAAADNTAVGMEACGGIGPYIPITGVTNAGTAVTANIASTANILVGSLVTIAGVTGFTTNNPNGDWIVTSLVANTSVTFTVANAPTGTYGSGGTLIGGYISGSRNTGVGSFALFTNQRGNGNTAVGYQSLYNNNAEGGSNTAVGYTALRTALGANLVAVGANAGFAATTADNLVAVGASAGLGVTTGDYSTFVGFQAGYPSEANASTSGGDQTCIGGLAGQSVAGEIAGITCLGRSAKAGGHYATALGAYTTAGATGSVALGCDNTGDPATTAVANEMKLGTALHTLNVIGNVRLGGAAKTLGFYGSGGVAKQVGVAVTPEAIHAALVALNLIAA